MIGILGGAFSPIHYGHLRLAAAAREQLGLEEVRLVPAGQPPLRKRPVIAAARRLHWVQLAVRDEPGLIADDREVRRPGPSYTIDTLAELRGAHPQAPLCLLLGQDKGGQLPRWRRWRELMDLAHLVFFNRPGAATDWPQEVQQELHGREVREPAELRRRPAGCCWRGLMAPVDISSSAVRERLRRGQSVQGLVPAAVIADFTSADLEAFAADEKERSAG